VSCLLMTKTEKTQVSRRKTTIAEVAREMQLPRLTESVRKDQDAQATRAAEKNVQLRK
jgi:hypothetical protein